MNNTWQYINTNTKRIVDYKLKLQQIENILYDKLDCKANNEKLVITVSNGLIILHIYTSNSYIKYYFSILTLKLVLTTTENIVKAEEISDLMLYTFTNTFDDYTEFIKLSVLDDQLEILKHHYLSSKNNISYT